MVGQFDEVAVGNDMKLNRKRPKMKNNYICSSIFSQRVTKIRYPSARSLPNLFATIPSLMVPGPRWLLQLAGEAPVGSFMCGLYTCMLACLLTFPGRVGGW